MSVVLAKSAGFCYGVRRAVELAERTAEEGRPCVMLGSIIHNKDGHRPSGRKGPDGGGGGLRRALRAAP